MTECDHSGVLFVMKRLFFNPISIGCNILILLINLVCIPLSHAEVDVRVRGTLIVEPCTLLPEDAEIEIDFDTIVDKYLYINKRTPLEPFTIHLVDCEVHAGQGVKVGFLGAENNKLPGMLALDKGSLIKGIGIGIKDRNGKLIPINSETPAYLLGNGTNDLIFQGYVEAESDAIKNKTIGLGRFQATAIFVLNYD